MKVGPDTGSRPTNESHLNGGVPRAGLLNPLHASPGLGAKAFSPLLTTLNPYDCTIPPGFSGSVDVGLSFSPEKTQIELACDVAATFGVRLPGGPITSLAKAALALAPARAAVQTATASNGFLRMLTSYLETPRCRKQQRGGFVIDPVSMRTDCDIADAVSRYVLRAGRVRMTIAPFLVPPIASVQRKPIFPDWGIREAFTSSHPRPAEVPLPVQSGD